jgi:TetR/AcrR family transcriptional regulator, regulator of autoinduction and epiphytic fitness
VTTTSLTDGRSARAARTREAVVEALLELIDEGNPRPTARQIADQAGVSLRSVYVHFDDLEDLFTAAAEKWFQRMAKHFRPLPTEGPLAERLEAFVEQRCRLLEANVAVRQAALLQEPFSPTLATVLRLGRQAARDQLELVFAHELGRERGGARQRLLAALDVVAGTATWDTLRQHNDLSPETARRVVTEMLTTLLAGRDR